MLYTLVLWCSAVFPTVSAVGCQGSIWLWVLIGDTCHTHAELCSDTVCNRTWAWFHALFLPKWCVAAVSGFSALFLFPLFSLCILHRFHSSFLFLILLYRSTEESGTGRSPTCFHGYRACACEGAYAHVFPFSFITFLRMVLCFWDSGKIMDSMSVCGGFYSVYSHFSSLFAILWNCDKLPIIKPMIVCVCVGGWVAANRSGWRPALLHSNPL